MNWKLVGLFPLREVARPFEPPPLLMRCREGVEVPLRDYGWGHEVVAADGHEYGHGELET
jgi:hypothetical protein